MSRQEIKERIYQSIHNLPHKEAVDRMALFGSQLHDTATAGSDVDILVRFVPNAHIGFFDLSHMSRFLEKELGKKVDLVSEKALSKYFRDEVIAESETLYERT